MSEERAPRERVIGAGDTLLRALIDAIPDLVWLKDPEGVYLACNPRFERFFCAKEAEIVGKTDHDFVDRELADSFREHDLRAVAAGCPSINEEWLTFRDDGHRELIETIKTPMRTSDGTLIGVLGIGRAITAARGAEDASRDVAAELEQRVAERTAELTDLYDNAPCGYHSLDPDGTILKINATELRWLGYARDEVIGRKLADFLAPEHVAPFLAAFTRFKERGSLTGWTQDMLRKDGSRLNTVLSATMIRDAEGRFLRTRATLFDDTERRRAAEAVAAAARAKDEFLASMSHELRTPLNGILGLTEILVDGIYGTINDRQRGALERIDESGRRLLALIDDVLDVAKIEAGKIELRLAPVDVELVCRAAIRQILEQARRKQLRLVHTGVFGLPPILADEQRLGQVVLNLLTNAVKFTPPGGKVSLEIAPLEEEQAVRVTVADTGVGIAPEDLGRLFRPFEQLDARLSREHAGTGLGLALVRRLVELHGGRVTVESEPGRGARFSVILPAVPAAPPEPAGAPDEARPPAPAIESRAARILIAEDDDSSAATLRDYLEAQGHEVHLASNGREVVERAEALLPDLIIMDVQMPGADGLAATRALRAGAPEVRGTPVLAVTALAMAGDEERCRAAGADAYMAKPVSLRALRDEVSHLLARSPRRQSARSRI